MAQAASKTCDICVSAYGSYYCLDCEQYFCENCKGFHKRQRVTKNHQFQSSSDVIPEGKSKCKDHNEDFSFVCKTCNLVVCSSCVTGSHSGHAFSKIMDCISQLKEKNKTRLHQLVHKTTKSMKKIEKGLKVFDEEEEEVIKAITKEGAKMKSMVDKRVAQMIASVKDQCMTGKGELIKSMTDIKMVLKTGSDFENKTSELEKTRNDAKLLQSLQNLANDIGKLGRCPVDRYPEIRYSARLATEKDIEKLFGEFFISDYRPGFEPYLYTCLNCDCGKEVRSYTYDELKCSCGTWTGFTETEYDSDSE